MSVFAPPPARMLKPIWAIADLVGVLSEQPNSAPPPGSQPLWGGSTTRAGRAPSPAPAAAATPASPAGPARTSQPLEPLSRRLLQVAGLLSLLLIAVVANSALSGEESPLDLNPVAAAAAKAEKVPGFRFDAYIVYSSPALPGPLSASGSGASNLETERSRLTLSLTSPETGRVQFFEVSDGEYNYEKSNTTDAALPPGKEWVRTAKDEKREEPEVDLDETMQMLSSSGGVRAVGRESVNGRMTRRYRAEISLSKLIELLREDGKDEAAEAYERLVGVAPTGISAEVWVDRRKMPRRMRFVIPVPGKEGDPPMTMDMRMDLFDFGAQPDIQLPDPDTVVEGPLDSSGAAISAEAS